MGTIFMADKAEWEVYQEIRKRFIDIEKLMHRIPSLARRSRIWDAIVRAGKDGTSSNCKYKPVSGLTHETEQSQAEWTGTVTEHKDTYGLA